MKIKLSYVVFCFCLIANIAVAKDVMLFNGKDLSGWTSVLDFDFVGGYRALESTWEVVNGAIRTTGTPFGYLLTKKNDFKDFTITLEYRWWRKTENPNSGVFLRVTNQTGTFLPKCYENQLCRGKVCDLLGLAGNPIKGTVPKSEYEPRDPLSGISIAKGTVPDAERPFGEWNKLEISVSKGMLVSKLNGVEQNRVDGLLDEKGAIALQSEGGAIEFRSIVVHEK